MKLKLRALIIAAATVVCTAQLGAQGIYFGLRGSGDFPVGAFNENATAGCSNCDNGTATALAAAKNGFGYGLDAGIQLGLIGVYAGFDHVNFDCESTTCNSDGKYKLQGVTAGIKLQPGPGLGLAKPFVKGGVTFNELEGGYGSAQSDLKTNRVPGYEIGVGMDINLLGILSFTPQARYIGQNFKYKVPGVNTTGATPTQGVNYYTIDLGMSLHTPFGGSKH